MARTAYYPELTGVRFKHLTEYTSDALKHGNTKLHILVREFIDFDLIEFKSTLNKRNKYGYTPLMCAILSRNLHAVELLLNESGTNLEIRDKQGNTAFLMAAATSPECLKLFIADPEKNMTNTIRNKNGISPLMAVIVSKYTSPSEKLEICQILIKTMYAIDLSDGVTHMRSALNYAMRSNSIEIIDMILNVIPVDLIIMNNLNLLNDLFYSAPSPSEFKSSTKEGFGRKRGDDKLRLFMSKYKECQFWRNINVIYLFIQTKTLHIYLESDPDVNVPCSNQKHLLSSICSFYNNSNPTYSDYILECISHVVARGAKDLNGAFICACKFGTVDHVKLLVDLGANINYQTEEVLLNFTRFNWRNSASILKYLLNNGVVFNIDLLEYINFARHELIEIALSYGVRSPDLFKKILNRSSEEHFRKLAILFLTYGVSHDDLECGPSYTLDINERIQFIKDESFNVCPVKCARP